MIKQSSSPATWKIVLAYGILYTVWGSTFLAIRIGVTEFPPLLFAAMRFLFAGFLLFCWTASRAETIPTRREWRSIFLLATLIFLLDYGFLFWAEKRVPSGVAAVLMATIPFFTALLEIWILRSQRFTPHLLAALVVGIGGVGVLALPSVRLGGVPVNRVAAAALLCGAFAWSLASVLSRRKQLPSSKFVSAGAQMLVGGLLLLSASWMAGEFHGLHWTSVGRGAWMSLTYLVFAGSLIGFTAYVWLITHQSPTRVGTYAFVNPVVAVFLGAVLGHEPVGTRPMLGCALVLLGVLGMLTGSQRARAFPPGKIAGKSDARGA